ncbi:hypothetical protein [Mycolicibacterium goodii]|uniref:Intersectin-EH binding protein Ibp1 n=1 Tax=Mycolicibacterium goodii TaxID=134601 RepID=A0ABS6HQ35_MYCGD|nr:hypothetical protein [Mycolicibacterium goodii]MBU8812570.1 hypothetical protein [Mycolicibacterium goodii]MBU8818833.1 hypothetical protein [Mycolicibacterium goodii]MBU8823463.1 hypothetical protein [Mycolicibacterium goodii]MBU8830116.1 hypothetical protein [Mycolicibacterium goodii]MBU8835488.1 hypothetical protein [Mycolicibacterium goodii]
MKIRPVVGVAVACSAVAVAFAPIAQAAEPHAQPVGEHIAPTPLKCTTVNTGSECISPGNAQINDAPPFVENYPMYGAFPWIL